jgi:hypothetical protein
MSRQLVNISEICRLTKIDRTTLAKYLRDGQVDPLNANAAKGAKEFYLDEVLTCLVQSFKIKAADGPKVRIELANAEKAEINVGKLRGELVETTLMRSTAAELVKSLYQRLVMLSPRILADKVTGNKERADVEIAIREHNAQVFDELRSMPNNFLNLPDVTDPERK